MNHRHFLFHRLTTLITYHSHTFSLRAKNLPFPQILPSIAFFFFSSPGMTTDCLAYQYFCAYPFPFFVFSFSPFLVFGSVQKIKLTYVNFQAHVKQAYRIIISYQYTVSPIAATEVVSIGRSRSHVCNCSYLLMRLMMVLSAWKSGRSAGSSAQHLFTVATSSSLLQPSPYSSASPSVGLISVGRNDWPGWPFFTSL